MRPSSLQTTNRPKGTGQGRSGKRGRQKEAYSRSSSNFDAFNFSVLEEIDTGSEEREDGDESTSDHGSEWESHDASGSDDDNEDISDCPACSRVAKAVRDWAGGGPEVRVSTFGRFQREQQWCDTCKQFVDYFTEKFQKREGGGAVLRHFTPVFLGYNVASWYFKVGKISCESLSLLRVSVPGPGEIRGIVPDASWINCKRVRRWAARCDRKHSGVCHSFSDPWLKVDLPSRMIVMDARNRCLVYAPKDAPYLALSYVWGKGADPLCTTLGNFSDFRRKNAFDIPRYRKRMPKTIRDSMLLTRSLGQRYLWVDRFCIVQDDADHKEVQLKAMASIYANAYLTIVAYDGDDDSYGLRGVGKGSEPRECTLQEFRFASDCHLVSRWPSISRTYVYPTRGWTFQEREVSRRRLTFQKGMVSWRCKLWTWDENEAEPQPAVDMPGAQHHEADLFARWPNLPHYANLVRLYNDCELTYPGDALNAFSALTTIMARSMRGGVLFGLPEMFFDGCLLWMGAEPVRRRCREVVTQDGFATSEVINRFPSWSWVGWAGGIDVHLWKDAHRFVAKEGEDPYSLQTPYLTITRIVDWFKINEKSGERERIQNSYYETSRPPQLPDGKTKRRIAVAARKGGSASRRKQQQRRSEPSSLQKKPSTTTKANSGVLPPGWDFRHHVLLAREPFAPDTETWSPVLEFRARRCFLTVGNILRQPREPIRRSDCITAGLVQDGSELDNVIGAIVLNTSDPQEIPTSTRCELIAISRGDADWVAGSFTMRRELPESELLHRQCIDRCDGTRECKGPRLYSFYNVLWVEWENNNSSTGGNKEKIAFRKGIGRVYQPFWDAQCAETIDVKLG